MAKNEIDILLSLDDKASGGLKKLDKNASKLKSTFKNSAVEINASLELIQKGIRAINKAFEFVERGARIEQQRQAFDRLAKSAGVSSKAIIKSMQEMAGGTISAADAMSGATKAMVLGLAPEKLPKLMEIARVSARAFGTDVGFMFDSLSLGIGRQSRMLLDNLGIIVDAEGAYKKYAEANGLVASALTDTQKKQAFLNAALEAGQDQIDKMGDSQLTNAESIAQMQAGFKDLIDTLAIIISRVAAATGVFESLNFVMKDWLEIIENVDEVANGLDESFNSALPALNETQKMLVKIQEARVTLEQRVASGAIGGEVVQKRINDLLIQEERLINSIIRLRGDESLDPFIGEEATPEEAVAIEKDNIEKEKLETRMNELIKFQEELSSMDDGEIAREITKLETIETLNKSSELNKLKLYKEAERAKESIAKKRAATEQRITQTATIQMDSFFAHMATKNKEAAIAWKAIQVTRAIISTADAVAEANPNIPLMAFAAAAGAAQVATIASTAFADGGIVKARPGGILAQIGEGGRDEAVIPLDDAGNALGFGDINIIVNNPNLSSDQDINDTAEMLGFEFERRARSARGI